MATEVRSGEKLQTWEWPDSNVKVYSSNGQIFGFLTVNGSLWQSTFPLTQETLGTNLKDATAADDYFRCRVPNFKGFRYSFRRFWLFKTPIIIFERNPTYQVQVKLPGKTETVEVSYYDTVHMIKHKLLDKGHYTCQLFFNSKLLDEQQYVGETQIPHNNSNVYAYYFGKVTERETCAKCREVFEKYNNSQLCREVFEKYNNSQL